MQLYYSDTYELPLPDGHRFPMAKYRRLRQRIAASDALGDAVLRLPPAATLAQLCRVHHADYVRRVFAGQLTTLQQRRIGFPWSKKMVLRSLRSTGASIAAAASALTDAVAVNLAGGTHHALPDAGSGYCVFNDCAVAARQMQAERAVQRVLFVDLDVHQGNGTAAVTAGDSSLFSFSMHGAANYPFRKTASDLDVALPDGTGDDAYLERLVESLDRIDALFAPDFVFYLAGADPWHGDRLGRLALTKGGLRHRDELVLQRFAARGIPIAVAMAGGYAPDIDDIADIHFQTIEAAAALRRGRLADAGARR